MTYLEELNAIQDSLGALGGELQHLAKGFYIVGNDNLADRLTGLRDIAAELRDDLAATTCRKVQEDCAQAQQASTNMIKAALAVSTDRASS